jgi:hypothetical protein
VFTNGDQVEARLVETPGFVELLWRQRPTLPTSAWDALSLQVLLHRGTVNAELLSQLLDLSTLFSSLDQFVYFVHTQP